MTERLPDRQLDLCGTPCPLNFIRCRLTLESMSAGQCLQVDLDPGEPEAMVVISGLVVLAIPGIILVAHYLQRHRG